MTSRSIRVVSGGFGRRCRQATVGGTSLRAGSRRLHRDSALTWTVAAPLGIRQQLVHRAGPEAPRIDLDGLEAGLSHGVEYGVASVRRLAEPLDDRGIELDPGPVVEIAYP